MGGRRFPVDDRGATLWEPENGNRGRLVVTLHQGNWIVGARHLAGRLGRVDSVAGVQIHPRWQRPIRRYLEEHGVHLWAGGDAFRHLLARLRAGGTVVLHLDGDQGGPPRRRWAHWPVPAGVRGAAVLAARSGCRVFAARCRRQAPGRFLFESRPIVAAGPGAAAGPLAVSGWERRFLETLREEVGRTPEDWMIFRPDHLGAAPARRPGVPNPGETGIPAGDRVVQPVG